MDDGYEDFHQAGYPVFAEYGIPVTVFLVSDEEVGSYSSRKITEGLATPPQTSSR